MVQGQEKELKAAEERARKDHKAQNQAIDAQNKAMDDSAEKVGASQDANPSRPSGRGS